MDSDQILESVVQKYNTILPMRIDDAVLKKGLTKEYTHLLKADNSLQPIFYISPTIGPNMILGAAIFDEEFAIFEGTLPLDYPAATKTFHKDGSFYPKDISFGIYTLRGGPGNLMVAGRFSRNDAVRYRGFISRWHEFLEQRPVITIGDIYVAAGHAGEKPEFSEMFQKATENYVKTLEFEKFVI